MNSQYQNSIFSTTTTKATPPVEKKWGTIFQKDVSAAKPAPAVGTNTLFSSLKKRIRVSVERSDLDKFTQDKVAGDKALSLILQTNVDTIQLEWVLQFGKEQQEMYADCASNVFKLAQNGAIVSSQHTLLEILSCITEAEYPGEGSDGFLSKLQLIKNRKKHAFDSAVECIQINSDLLKDKLPVLLDIISSVNTFTNIISTLTLQLEPAIVASAFFSEYKKDNFPAELFLSRSNSLLDTRLMCSQSKLQLDTLSNTVISLIDTINQTILCDIPQWLSNCNDSQQKTNIINKIKQATNK
jgi:hypothetical protein